MYTLRLPFRTTQSRAINLPAIEQTCTFRDLILNITFSDPYYVLHIKGFNSEDQARQFLHNAQLGFAWALLQRKLSYHADFKLEKVKYFEDPIAAAHNLNASLGKTFFDKVDALVDGSSASIIQSAKEIRFNTGNDVGFKVGTPVHQVLESMMDGMSFSDPDKVTNDKQLATAIDLYRAHFFEQSGTAKFLTLVMALESIAPKLEKHKIALELLDKWKAEILEVKADHSGNVDELHSLESLDRELFFRRDASLRSSIKTLVASTLSKIGIEDADEYARQAVKLYDLRGTLVHEGTVDEKDLDGALQKCAEIVQLVLTGAIRLAASS